MHEEECCCSAPILYEFKEDLIKSWNTRYEPLKLTPSCGNVFEDLGLDNADELLKLSELKRKRGDKFWKEEDNDDD